MGPCTVWGVNVGDDETIEYYIQEKVNECNFPYEVINAGFPRLGYGEQGLFLEQMSEGDKVILAFPSWNRYDREIIKRNFPREYKCDWSEVYAHLEDPINSWSNATSHCNGSVNKKIAECIWDDLCRDGKWILEEGVYSERKALQDYYIPYEIYRYFEEYMAEYSLYLDEKQKTGAIVMNCNPFTLGHKYLITKASESVDFLYVFVVEEDKSYYSFKDRFEMVKRGVADLANVKVLPSGRFILSKDTFAQYFEKESIKEVEDMSWDIRIFGEVVAKKLGITYRFIGEEPKDIVTKEYNETMKRILPEYDVNVIEIPRVHIKNSNEVISATTVRSLIQNNDWEAVKKYCPDSTIKYLVERELR